MKAVGITLLSAQAKCVASTACDATHVAPDHRHIIREFVSGWAVRNGRINGAYVGVTENGLLEISFNDKMDRKKTIEICCGR